MHSFILLASCLVCATGPSFSAHYLQGDSAHILIKDVKQFYHIQPSIGRDPIIKDLSASSIPPQPPQGYRCLMVGENNFGIREAATYILHHSELGDQIPFTVDGHQYIGRAEPHYDKQKGWHYGITVFRAKLDS